MSLGCGIAASVSIFISHVAIIPSGNNTVISYPQDSELPPASCHPLVSQLSLHFSAPTEENKRETGVACCIRCAELPTGLAKVKVAPGTDCQDNFLNLCSTRLAGSSLTSCKAALS